MSAKEGWRRPFAVILLCHAGVFLAFSAAFPFVALYLLELGVDDSQLAAGWAGVINGSTTAIVSLTNPMWGSLSDRWGVKTGLVRCLIMSILGLVVCSFATGPEHVLITGVCVQAALATLAQVFVERPETFVALRAVVGLSYGAAVVLMRAALGAAAPAERRGVTYGVGQSAFAAGFSVGALAGSAVAVSAGVLPTFGLSACAFLLVAGWAFATFPRPRPAHVEELVTAP